ncbi:hypothetical protein C8F01DRAFT_639627 [Mycena amicta]|nr:hypothetical protein C8F01DRAFT_639627 [Mycena amicta]
MESPLRAAANFLPSHPRQRSTTSTASEGTTDLDGTVLRTVPLSRSKVQGPSSWRRSLSGCSIHLSPPLAPDTPFPSRRSQSILSAIATVSRQCMSGARIVMCGCPVHTHGLRLERCLPPCPLLISISLSSRKIRGDILHPSVPIHPDNGVHPYQYRRPTGPTPNHCRCLCSVLQAYMLNLGIRQASSESTHAHFHRAPASLHTSPLLLYRMSQYPSHSPESSVFRRPRFRPTSAFWYPDSRSRHWRICRSWATPAHGHSPASRCAAWLTREGLCV